MLLYQGPRQLYTLSLTIITVLRIDFGVSYISFIRKMCVYVQVTIQHLQINSEGVFYSICYI